MTNVKILDLSYNGIRKLIIQVIDKSFLPKL